MVTMIDPNTPLTQLELAVVYLRYFEGLPSSEVAEQLGIELEKVNEKMKKPNVSRYIRMVAPAQKQNRPRVKLNTLNSESTIGTKLYYFAGFILFVFLAVVCTKLFL